MDLSWVDVKAAEQARKHFIAEFEVSFVLIKKMLIFQNWVTELRHWKFTRHEFLVSKFEEFDKYVAGNRKYSFHYFFIDYFLDINMWIWLRSSLTTAVSARACVFEGKKRRDERNDAMGDVPCERWRERTRNHHFTGRGERRERFVTRGEKQERRKETRYLFYAVIRCAINLGNTDAGQEPSDSF